MRVRVAVSFELPEDATREDAVDYVLDAVATMKGCYRPAGGLGPDDPGDVMFYLDSDTVSASAPITKNGKRKIYRRSMS